jgi:hypothetical protein
MSGILIGGLIGEGRDVAHSFVGKPERMTILKNK